MFWRYRTALTLLLAGSIACGIGAIRGIEDPMEDLESFQAMRVNWGPRFDMVLAGDSRVNQDISPEEIKKYLPDYRIANFGWGLVNFYGEYLEAIEGLLDPTSDIRTVIIGISPLALTELGSVTNEYIENKNRHPAESWQKYAFREFLSYFRPLEFQERRVLRIRGRLDRIKEFHPDGWAAATMKPEKPDISLGFHRSHFSNYKVSEKVVSALLDAVSRWQRDDIAVIGFLMPASPEMLKLENEISGFNEKSFSNRFQLAGGTWINLEIDKYHSYDANHLRMDAARQFSRALGRRLSNKLSKK